MPLSLTELQTPLTTAQVREVLTVLLTSLGFPVTAWQDGGSTRSLLEGQAALGASLTERTSELSKLAFLGFAAGEYLDALGKSHYDEVRNDPQSSVFDVDMINSGVVTHTPAAGEITLRATNGETFLNTAGATVSAGATTVVEFFAQIPSAAGNVGPQALELVTPLAGVTTYFDGLVTSAGADIESDAKYKERCRAKWGLLSVEKASSGVLSLARGASASIHGVYVDATNPRGAGTLDVYLAAENATAGDADVALVQTALDAAFFDNGVAEKRALAIAAPTVAQPLTAEVYVAGVSEADALVLLLAAWDAFILSVPIGGFDLSPGPKNVVQAGQIIEALAAVENVVSIQVTTPSGDLPVPANTKVLTGVTSITIVVLAAAP